MTTPKKTHQNDERTVKCPVEGCDATPLARGVHLHVMRSVGDGHGLQDEVPDNISLDDLETVGAREVQMRYPEKREVESVARLCPYCDIPFRGKKGVLIHLGQVAGRKNHPANASSLHESEEFPIVNVDEHENIVDVVEDDEVLSSYEPHPESIPVERVYRYIADLLAEGSREEAARARAQLLGDTK